MKYLITLTDEANNNSAQIERDLVAHGAKNIEFLKAIGIITADFESPPNLGAVSGVLDVEEDQTNIAFQKIKALPDLAVSLEDVAASLEEPGKKW